MNDTPHAPARAGRGRTSAQPSGAYEPAPPVQVTVEGTRVDFHGEDGRRAVYEFGRLPCAGLHADLAAAFAARTGEVGGRRTLSSADGLARILRRFLRWLGTLPSPPRNLGQLRRSHLDRFRLHLAASTGARHTDRILHDTCTTLAKVPPQRLRPDVAEFVRAPGQTAGHGRLEGQPGYSDKEFGAILRAARRDVVAIRDRIGRAERLMSTYDEAADTLEPNQRELAAMLVEMARTGRGAPSLAGTAGPTWTARVYQVARHLFLTRADLAPLLVLAVALTGRNAETVKEFPAEHRILDDRAVAVSLVKRRRGKSLSRQTVHWEVGPASRQLHTPGGFYLLVHRLTSRGRSLSGTSGLWSVFAQDSTAEPGSALASRFGHRDPFKDRLSSWYGLARWAHGHGLTDDDGAALRLTLNRIKTTAEVRTTRDLGGHLPSASRTNTMDVSFLHYLRSDPTIRDWADQILTTAIEQAHDSATRFHLRIMDSAAHRAFHKDPQGTAARLGTSPQTISAAVHGDLDTLASACLDFEHHPDTGQRCQASFLTCLRCPNALVTEHHLPALLALADLLARKLETMNVADWCATHGVNWLIITRMILPRFTQAQQDAAARQRPDTALWNLLDGPQEEQ